MRRFRCRIHVRPLYIYGDVRLSFEVPRGSVVDSSSLHIPKWCLFVRTVIVAMAIHPRRLLSDWDVYMAARGSSLHGLDYCRTPCVLVGVSDVAAFELAACLRRRSRRSYQILEP